MAPSSNRRYLALWFPSLPTDRLHRLAMRNARRSGSAASPPERPLAMVTRQGGALRLVAVDAMALSRGLRTGLGLAQAQAMVPDLVVRPHDPSADAHLLEAIADWADRYTPFVARTPPDGLMLDITGAAHLLGGEAPLQADLAGRLTSQGFAIATVIAPTPGAAWALARYAGGGTIVEEAGLRAALAPLPVAALRLSTETAASLARTGLKMIGDLMDRPRAPLAARFGPLLLQRLDQALGLDEEAIGPRQPIPPARVEHRLAEPIVREEDVSAVALRLADDLCRRLAERDEGACHAVLTVFRVDGVVRRLEVGLAEPCREAKTLHGLFALRLGHLEDPLDPGYGFDLVRLEATTVAPRGAEAPHLSIAGATAPHEHARTLVRLGDRLAARFGNNQVLRPHLVDTHLPELAGRLRPARQTSLQAATAPVTLPDEVGPLRPLRLFEPPEPAEIMAEVPDGPPLRLKWRRQSLRVSAAEGPERMAPHWWHGGAIAPSKPAAPRDYYRVVDEHGRRLWIFREGLFGASPPPRWFVHGVFA